MSKTKAADEIPSAAFVFTDSVNLFTKPTLCRPVQCDFCAFCNRLLSNKSKFQVLSIISMARQVKPIMKKNLFSRAKFAGASPTSQPQISQGSYQRRYTAIALSVIAGFVALPVLTSRAQNTPPPFSLQTPVTAPTNPAPANSASVTAPANAPATPEADRACLTPPAGLSVWLPGEGIHKDVYANKVQADEKQLYEAGKVGQAFTMNGTYLRVLASPKTDVAAGVGFTWECWVNPSDVAPMHPIFDFNNGETFGVHLWIFNGNGGLMANLMDTTGTPHMVETQAGVLKAGEWQHIALTYDKKTSVGSIYVNGLLVGEKTLGPFRPQTTYDLYVGYRPAGLGKDRRFNGAIDEISLYNRPLSAAEIKTIFNAGAAGKCNPQTAKPVTTKPASVTAPTPTPTPTPAPTPTPTPTMIPALKMKPPIAIFTLGAGEGVSSEVAIRITDALTEELRKAGVQVKPRQHMDKLFTSLMAEPEKSPIAEDVRAAALRRKATAQMASNTVLFGKIEQLYLTKNQGRLKLNLQLVDAASNRALPDIVVSESTAEKTEPATEDALLAEVINKIMPIAAARIKTVTN